MIRTALCLAIGLAATLTHCAGPADAATSTVTAELVCDVQDAIRFRAPAFTPGTCRHIATAAARTPDPVLTLSIIIVESDLRFDAIAWHGPNLADVGGMGVRCHLGQDRRCANGPARGLTIAQLMDPSTNIAVGSAVLASKARLQDYNGSPTYPDRVGAIAAALGGVEIRSASKRVRGLVRRILAAVNKQRRS